MCTPQTTCHQSQHLTIWSPIHGPDSQQPIVTATEASCLGLLRNSTMLLLPPADRLLLLLLLFLPYHRHLPHLCLLLLLLPPLLVPSVNISSAFLSLPLTLQHLILASPSSVLFSPPLCVPLCLLLLHLSPRPSPSLTAPDRGVLQTLAHGHACMQHRKHKNMRKLTQYGEGNTGSHTAETVSDWWPFRGVSQ